MVNLREPFGYRCRPRTAARAAPGVTGTTIASDASMTVLRDTGSGARTLP
jgi:hypothetical protein